MTLLDTNAYSALARGMPSVTDVLGNDEIVMCVPVVAELRVGFLLGNQQDKNEKKLLRMLSSSELIAPNNETTQIYSELAAFCRRRGRTLSNNDIWIAALARQHGARLLTYDKDFVVFKELLGDKLMILV